MRYFNTIQDRIGVVGKKFSAADGSILGVCDRGSQENFLFNPSLMGNYR